MSNFKQAISELVNDLDEVKEKLKDQEYRKIIEQVSKVNSQPNVDVSAMTEEQKNILLVSINPDLLMTLNNPSEKVVLEAVKKKPSLIGDIRNAPCSIVMTAVKQDSNLLSHVQWFEPTTIQELKQNGITIAFSWNDTRHKWEMWKKVNNDWTKIEHVEN